MISPSMATALSVTAAMSYRSVRPVRLDPAATVDLFSFSETLPTPLDGMDRSGVNGAELDVVGTGFVAARLDSDSGPGAIAVTRAGKVITHGFSPHDVAMTDGDGDGTPDMQELYVNEVLYLFR